VSGLYVFGRKQDVALQRARRSISQRNHMRLWLAPFRVEGNSVWVGQVSRDIGVKVTPKSPTLTTHVIDRRSTRRASTCCTAWSPRDSSTGSAS